MCIRDSCDEGVLEWIHQDRLAALPPWAGDRLFLALLRKVILLIPLIFLLPNLLSDKVLAVFLAEPAADITAALVTGSVFLWHFPKILAQRELQLRQGQRLSLIHI